MIIDSWINVQAEALARARAAPGRLHDETRAIFRDEGVFAVRTPDDVIAEMDDVGVDLAVVSASARLGSSAFGANY